MTQPSTRRRFIQIVPITGMALATGTVFAASHSGAPAASKKASAATPTAPASASGSTPGVAMLNEKDTQAVALGYVADAAKADKVKFKNVVAGANCGNCALYQGKATDAAAACPLFAGKGNVAAKGWCSAYAKKG